MHHHTIKTQNATVAVFIEKHATMLEPEIIEAMRRGFVLVAPTQGRAAVIFARCFDLNEDEFKEALARHEDWQVAYLETRKGN